MKLEQVPTPAYVIDLAKLEANCRILQYVQEEGRLQGLACPEGIFPLQNLSLD